MDRIPPQPDARPAGGRRRQDPVVAQVVRAARLTPGLVRLVVGGPGMATFEPPVHTDSYVKLVFAPPGPRPLLADGRVDLAAVRAAAGPDEVRLRAYTVRQFDPATRELTLDVVVHGEEGVAGPWAAAVRPGDEVLLLGPGGAWTPDPSADAHMLIGDSSALPAVAVALERLPRHAAGHALIEVARADERLDLVHPPAVRLQWVLTRGAPGTALVEAVRALPWPAGRLEAFVHGEAGAVRALRHHLRVERGLPRESLSISGYWRLGMDDEGWRRSKREWTEQLESAERAAGLL